jgi:hypothetical protein
VTDLDRKSGGADGTRTTPGVTGRLPESLFSLYILALTPTPLRYSMAGTARISR